MKSKGFGKCHLELDTDSQKLVEGYKQASTSNFSLNQASNYIFIDLEIVPDNPLLVAWPWGNEDEQGRRDAWIDSLEAETTEHKNIMEQVVSGNARSWGDIKSLQGGQKFESEHMRRGQPMDLSQLKRNFPKAIQNDGTLMDFLKGHKKKVHEELDREAHTDFREDKGAMTRGKPYDQIFNRAIVREGDTNQWALSMPGSTIKGAFRVKAQQILRTMKNGKGCKEKTSSHDNRFCDDRDCPVCSLFGRQGMIARVHFSDAHLSTGDHLLDDEHCSYDQIAIDKKTGASIENSKLNFLVSIHHCEVIWIHPMKYIYSRGHYRT